MHDPSPPQSVPDSTAPAPPAVRFRQAFVLGVPRCGSTLVGRILDSHPRVFCSGEVARAGLALKNEKPCSCGAPLEECEFWGPRLGLLREVGYDYRRFTSALLEELRATTDADLLVDASKSRVWRMMSGLRAPLRGSNPALVLVYRDPRGIMASRLRRGAGPLRALLGSYRKWMRRQDRLCRAQGERGLFLGYEELCANPEGEVRRLCEFLGLDFRAEMMNPGAHVHHFIHSSSSSTFDPGKGIRLDERWREELTPAQVDEIEATMRRLPEVRRRYLDGTPG